VVLFGSVIDLFFGRHVNESATRAREHTDALETRRDETRKRVSNQKSEAVKISAQ
jgi:hypothetical protein